MAMELSDFLRLPIKVGVGLTKANTTHDKTRIVSPAFDNYFRTLIDNINQRHYYKFSKRSSN